MADKRKELTEQITTEIQNVENIGTLEYLATFIHLFLGRWGQIMKEQLLDLIEGIDNDRFIRFLYKLISGLVENWSIYTKKA